MPRRRGCSCLVPRAGPGGGAQRGRWRRAGGAGVSRERSGQPRRGGGPGLAGGASSPTCGRTQALPPPGRAGVRGVSWAGAARSGAVCEGPGGAPGGERPGRAGARLALRGRVCVGRGFCVGVRPAGPGAAGWETLRGEKGRNAPGRPPPLAGLRRLLALAEPPGKLLSRGLCHFQLSQGRKCFDCV